MNSFAALTLDSDDENEAPKVNNKKTTTTAPAAKATKAPMVQRNVPGLNKKTFTATTTPAPTYAAEDPASTKVNDRGGKRREMYNGHSSVKGSVPNDHKAHKDRHDYARSGKSAGGAKDGARGGRGPGGWGNAEEEARRATKGEDAVEGGEAAEATAEGEEAAVEEVAPAPTVFGFEEAMARREAARAASAIFGSVQERKVEAPSDLKVVAKEEIPEDMQKKSKAKKASGPQRSNLKATVDSSFRVENSFAEAPREPREARGNGRDSGRGGRGGAPARGGGAAAPGPKLRDDDFPAL